MKHRNYMIYIFCKECQKAFREMCGIRPKKLWRIKNKHIGAEWVGELEMEVLPFWASLYTLYALKLWKWIICLKSGGWSYVCM